MRTDPQRAPASPRARPPPATSTPSAPSGGASPTTGGASASSAGARAAAAPAQIAGDQVYCTTAQRFTADLSTPPAVALLSHTLRGGTRAGVQISLSKISTVAMTVRQGSRVVWTQPGDRRGRGRPKLLWVTPAKGGTLLGHADGDRPGGQLRDGQRLDRRQPALARGATPRLGVSEHAQQTPAAGPGAAMTRLARAWGAMSRERRIAALAALALLVTMFLPWYGLQSLNRKTGVIYSHNINAFGDVSFVEAAIFLVAAGVMAMLLARAEGRDFNLPGGDGTIVAIAGGWAAVLIFYRVFDRPSGNGYPVGIEWGILPRLRRGGEPRLRGLADARRRNGPSRLPRVTATARARPSPTTTSLAFTTPGSPRRHRPAAGTSRRRRRRRRHRTRCSFPPARARGGRCRRATGAREAGGRRYPPAPPAPPEQLSFEDPPHRPE